MSNELSNPRWVEFINHGQKVLGFEFVVNGPLAFAHITSSELLCPS
jgi:hypothetical protein